MSLSRFTGEIRDDVSKSEDTVSRSLGVETHVLFRSRFHGIHGARTLYTTHGRKGREREVEKKRVMYEEDICDQKIYSFTGEVCMYICFLFLRRRRKYVQVPDKKYSNSHVGTLNTHDDI